MIRLVEWYTRGIWKKPLLWVLYLGYGGATFGFLLKALEPFSTLSPSLALHAFALGGIGMITAGMMSRIALGHTGRDIQQHSPLARADIHPVDRGLRCPGTVADDRSEQITRGGWAWHRRHG